MVFTNTTDAALPVTHYWEFGNGDVNDGEVSPAYLGFHQAGHFHTKLTVTDILGCKQQADKFIDVISLDIRTLVHDTDVCLRIPMQIFTDKTLKNFGQNPVKFVWTQTPSGSNLDDFNAQHPFFWGIGTYTLGVTAFTKTFGTNPPMSTIGCSDTDAVVIRSHPPVTITNLTRSPQVLQLGKSLQLNADGGDYYRWAPENGSLNNMNINNPVVTPKDSATMYSVFVMNKWGCVDTGYVKVYVDLGTDQFVPSAFTPNGDGRNDIFRIIKLNYQKLVDFRVFTRWGECVFQTSNPEMGWDGTFKGANMDLGTYLYEIIVALPDGTNKTYKGNVTLIR